MEFVILIFGLTTVGSFLIFLLGCMFGVWDFTKKSVLIASFVSILIGLIPAIYMDYSNKKWKEEHRTGIYQCPKCQSYETEGFDTFWYKDGMLCNGSREYNLEHAHYTIMSCEYCGNSWRLYKKDW